MRALMPSHPRAVAVTAGFALMLAFALAVTAPKTQPGGQPPFSGSVLVSQGGTRAGCTGLIAAVPPDDVADLAPLFAAYDAGGRKVGGRCVDVRLLPKAPGSAADALVRGWKTDTDGTSPDLWLPGATSWVELVRARIGGAAAVLIPGDTPGFAQSPFVIAMPRPMAEALGWPSTPIGFTDLVAVGTDPRGWGHAGHPEWGGLRLGKTNPLLATTGLHALIAAYFAGTGVSADLTAANLANPKVVAFVKGVELATVHYGESSSVFLQNLAQADAAGQSLTYVSAIALEERQVTAYNAGRFDASGKQPTVQLAAIYPKEGTLISDNPFVVLNASWVSADQKAAAADVLAYLRAPEQQAKLQQAGYRDANGRVGTIVSAGTLPNQPTAIIKPPSGDVLAKVQASWWTIRKPARVLIIVDVSGSMDAIVPGTSGATKLDLVKAALGAAIQQVGDDDEIGLWSFSDTRRQLVPIARVGGQRAKLQSAVASLSANGGTLLYTTVRDGWDFVRTTVDPTHISAVVVLTDGQDNGSPLGSLNSLTTALSAQPPGAAVRIFTVAYGGDADRQVLGSIARASRGEAYDATNPALIREVFLAVLSNF
jgi:Ca-activated chloride channel family protein